MKGLIRILYCLIGLFLTANIQAQIPGYLGHKTTVGVVLQGFPSYRNYGYNPKAYNPSWTPGSTTSNNDWGIKTATGLFIDQVIDRTISLNVQYNYQRGGYYSEVADTFYDSQGNLNINFTNSPYNVISHRIDASFKFFLSNNGGLAPLGTYIGLGLNYSMVKGFEKDSIAPIRYNKSLTGMHFTFGKSRIINDKIMFDYGLQIVPFFFNADVNILNQPNEKLKPASYMFGRNWFFAYCNIGFLL